MTQATGGMRDQGRGTGSGSPRQVLVLAIGDGREDWMLPEEVFVAAGCRLVRAESLAEAATRCDGAMPDLVFMPLTLDGKPTTDQLRTCLARQPAPVVVVLASNDQINTAAEAMRQGAHDCLFKPFSRSRLSRTIEEALKQLKRLPAPKSAARVPGTVAVRTRAPSPPRQQPAAPPEPSPARLDRLGLAGRGFVASSPQMRAVLEKAAAVAKSDAPVFISGEVATGKSALAAIVHELSHRASGPFVTLTCATLTPDEIDARMSVPGGLLARAAGGTVYLDEIADLPLEVQPRLLRLIDRATGGAARPGVRIIASTGHDPVVVLRKGLIRPDLFYRLHVAPIQLPPLRARDGDPALIARVLLAEFSETEGRGFVGFSDSALAMIDAYAWPGNLRELVNVIWSVVLMNQGPLVTPDLMPAELRTGLRGPGPLDSDGDRPAGPAAGPHAAAPGAEGGIGGLVGKSLAEIERAVIEATIRAQGGSVPRAARVLDVSPSTLYRKREAWAKATGDGAPGTG